MITQAEPVTWDLDDHAAPERAAVVASVVRVEVNDPARIALWRAINWLDLGAPGKARAILIELVKAL
jgi:hypothetical protein